MVQSRLPFTSSPARRGRRSRVPLGRRWCGGEGCGDREEVAVGGVWRWGGDGWGCVCGDGELGVQQVRDGLVSDGKWVENAWPY